MNFEDSVGLIVSICVIIFICMGIGYVLTQTFTTGQENITIEEKWVKYDGSNAKYLISSDDGQVFELTDSYRYWRFDSSNLYATIKTNKTCYIQTQGYRVGFMSDYKNIINARCD